MIRALLTAAYLLLLAALWLHPMADARMHYPARGHRIVSGGQAPLDGFTQPSGAYSFRKLRSTYAGPALRIRRASDNAELDINFLGFTGFTGAPWDLAAATAHCASTSCFLVNWYDQSGLVRDLPQATAANQFALVFGCDGALPCFRATVNTQFLVGPSVALTTGVVTLNAVANRNAGTGVCSLIKPNGGAGNNAAARIQTTSAVANQWGLVGGTSGSVVATANDAVWHSGIGVINGASSELGIDGAVTAGATVAGTVAGPVTMAGAATTTCSFAEAIVWDNYVLTAGEKTALVANQRSFGWIP